MVPCVFTMDFHWVVYLLNCLWCLDPYFLRELMITSASSYTEVFTDLFGRSPAVI